MTCPPSIHSLLLEDEDRFPVSADNVTVESEVFSELSVQLVLATVATDITVADAVAYEMIDVLLDTVWHPLVHAMRMRVLFVCNDMKDSTRCACRCIDLTCAITHMNAYTMLRPQATLQSQLATELVLDMPIEITDLQAQYTLRDQGVVVVNASIEDLIIDDPVSGPSRPEEQVAIQTIESVTAVVTVSIATAMAASVASSVVAAVASSVASAAAGAAGGSAGGGAAASSSGGGSALPLVFGAQRFQASTGLAIETSPLQSGVADSLGWASGNFGLAGGQSPSAQSEPARRRLRRLFRWLAISRADRDDYGGGLDDNSFTGGAAPSGAWINATRGLNGTINGTGNSSASTPSNIAPYTVLLGLLATAGIVFLSVMACQVRTMFLTNIIFSPTYKTAYLLLMTRLLRTVSGGHV